MEGYIYHITNKLNNNIRRPNLYLQAKEYYSHLTPQDKNKILQQNVYQTAVEKSRNKAGNLT